MKTVAGVFAVRSDAQRVAQLLASDGVSKDNIALLFPGETDEEVESEVLVSGTEQPGMGKTMGAVVGTAAGAATGVEVAAVTAVIPGIGVVIALGILGAAIIGTIGAAIGKRLDSSTAEGLPEDELFVYEDALRQGRSVLLALVDNEDTAVYVRRVMEEQRAESIDAARKEWWIGLRSAEEEHYQALGRNFHQEEHFYRLGFETALNPRNRDKCWDQAMTGKAPEIEEIRRQYPNVEWEKPFQHGYERGQAHYDSWRDHP